MNAATEEPAGYAEQRSSRIEETVARDLARRRRLVRIYLVLLVVPLAVVAVFMLYGRTDREIVAQEVDQRVQPVEETYRKIEPMLADVQNVGEWLPQVRGVDTRLQTYERGQSDLAERVASVAAEVGELKPAVDEAREARAEVKELRRTYDQQRTQLLQRFDAFERQLGPAGEESGGVRRPPRELYATGTTAPPDVEALTQRVKELEATVAALQRNVRRLQAELEHR